jgi:hypothetical protein
MTMQGSVRKISGAKGSTWLGVRDLPPRPGNRYPPPETGQWLPRREVEDRLREFSPFDLQRLSVDSMSYG